jgi:hypothetical protein
MPAPRDLATILYQPRETMRRVLDSPQRWWWQIVAAAAVATHIGDADVVKTTLPGFSRLALIGLGIGGVIANAIAWILLTWIFGWIAAGAGRMLGGSAPARDVRDALAWGLVPLVWSIFIRVPEAIYRHALLPARKGGSEREMVLNVIANGGCSMLVVAMVAGLILTVACIWIATSTLAEVQRFSLAQAFGNLAIAVITPIAIIAAAVIAANV